MKVSTLRETQDAFECCVSTPPACDICPLREFEEKQERLRCRSWECRQQVKDSVRYWLRQAKEDETL